MASLTDVYQGHWARVADRRRQVLGSTVFLVGVGLLVVAIGLATTAVGYRTFGEYAAREMGGVAAGIGLQAVLVGVFVVLPASRRVRAGAVIGTAVALLGVALFTYAYPYNWVLGAPLLALATTTTYFFGVATTFWCLFVALATFKTRHDPGGTARVRLSEEATIRLEQAARSTPGLGGVGLFGPDPDGDVDTQTNRGSGPERSARAVSDGGAAARDGSRSGARPSTDPAGGRSGHWDERADTYCGNCRHFEYVSAGEESVPYCRFRSEQMADMDACSAWTRL